MTVGGRQYNEAEMIQMQREAEERVREMQARTRQAAEDANNTGAPLNNNWSNNPGMYRRRPPRWSIGWPQGQQQNFQQGHQRHQADRQEASSSSPSPSPPPSSPPPHAEAPSRPRVAEGPPPPPKDGTIVGDIMSALSLDEDYLLIIGLLLILINQRADTTLILALAYLLI